jgi:hypothetical protein
LPRSFAVTIHPNGSQKYRPASSINLTNFFCAS